MRKALFNKRVDVEERRDTRNQIMATESDWSTKFRSVPCEIEVVSAKEQIFQNRESVEKIFRLYTEETDINERDRVVGKESPLERDSRYEIIGVSPWDNYTELRLRLWQ